VTTRRWTLPLFIALAILHVVPIWSVRYLPTGDGPTHVYNAWVLHGLLTGTAPANIAHAYRIDWKPHPNWSGHLLMAAAMTAVPPLVAEKLFVTLILVLMLAGTWLLATAVDPRNDVYAFLAFPFTWTQSLLAGYYNFSLSVGLYLLILAIWWRRRERPSIGSVLLIAALLVLCNFTHPMATALACGSIVLLSLLTRRFAHLAAIVPVLPLLVRFGSTAESNVGAPMQLAIEWDAARFLARIETLYAFDDRIRPIAIAVALLYAGLIVFTLTREKRREADAIAVLALALIAMMFWLPAAQGTRDLFTGRMQPFVFLILPAWFTPRLEGRRRTVLAALLATIAIANATIAIERFREFGPELQRMVRTFAPIEPETTLLPLFFDRPHSNSYVDLFPHFISYVALEKRLVDASNYEPSTHYFPIADRVPAFGSHTIDIDPGGVDLAQPIAGAEYVVTYAYPQDARNRGSLRALYSLVKDAGPFRIHRRRAPVPGERDLVLLPLLGTANELGAPHGARWRIDQSLHNRDSKPMRVLFRQCPEGLWCDRELAPGEIVPIAITEGRFAFIDVPRGRDELLGITTVVRRADVDRPETSISLPSVHEREFTRGGTRIANIDTRGNKIGLRLYVFGRSARNVVMLRLRAGDGKLAAERRLDLDNYGMYENAELRSEVAGAPLPDTLHIEIEAEPDARVWAFVTATDADGKTRVLESRRLAIDSRQSAVGSRQ
jgi:hypothetical protein